MAIHISRSEQHTMYYWTGNGWTTNKQKAKPFASIKEAQQEKKNKEIKYTVSYSQ